MTLRSPFVGLIILVLTLTVVGCGSGDDGGAAGDGGNGGSAGSGGTGGAGSGGSGGTGGTGGTGGGGGSGDPCVPTGNRCPTHTATGTDITCDLDLTGGDDLVQDTRLEFGDGPDHAILFTVPEAGDYAVTFSNDPSSNSACGVSAHNAAGVFHTAGSCPPAAATNDLDGFFSSGAAFPHTWTAGQEVALFVGCAYWGDVDEGPYTVSVEKL